MNKKPLKLFSLPSFLIASSFVICYLLIVICSCEQPFKAGLGPVIDLQDPTIVLKSPKAGSFIRGVVSFTGSASDDYMLDTVWFNIANRPDVDLTAIPPEAYRKTPPISYRKLIIGNDVFYKITNTNGDTRNITWEFKIDTTLMVDVLDEYGEPVYEDGIRKQEKVFPDGPFNIRLRVTDSMGKFAITDEIVFFIKNDIPQISIDTPAIEQGTEPGELGGISLNYNYRSSDPKQFRRTVYIEEYIMGSISDDEGIYRDDEMTIQVVDENGNPVFDNKGLPAMIELYPPQMRFWQVNFNGSASDNADAKPDGWVPSDNPLDSDYMPWEKIGKGGIGEFTGGDGNKTLVFTHTLSEKDGYKSGQYYAFQVRAHSIDRVHSRAEYPRDYINYDFFDASGNLNRLDPVVQENAYVLIRVIEPLEFPTLGLYKLEDIYGAEKNNLPKRASASGNAAIGAMQYNRLPEDEIKKEEITDMVELVGNHSYIDKTTVSKGGPFILRVWTKHPQDIASAKVYWERDGSPDKGRFIWDWNDRPDGWPKVGGDFRGIDKPYYEWGLNEWNGVGETTFNNTLRSYVFTYKDDGNDKVPNNAYADIRGTSKVQKYKGSETVTDDKGVTRKRELDEFPDEMANWTGLDQLPEGNYTLSIYTTSSGGTRCMMPLLVYLTIDRTKPDIILDDIKGKVGDNIEEPFTVNGVIQPKFVISDSQSTIRPGTPIEYFAKNDPAPPKKYYSEQMYILVKETKADIDAMDKYFKLGDYLDTKKNIWPKFVEPDDPLYNPSSPALAEIKKDDGTPIKFYKHGLIIDSVCRFRTSKIYHIPPLPSSNPEDTPGEFLTDGPYRLYAFVRDSAFNVNSLSFKIIVDEKTDYPEFDWKDEESEIKKSVTQPDSAYDFGGSEYDKQPDTVDKSFRVKNGDIRNKLEPGASIIVKIKDDDGLDLGVKGNGGTQPDKDSGVKVTFIGSKPHDVTGVIEPLPDSHLITLEDADVKKAFPPMTTNGKGDILLVKETTGTISQTILLDKLKANNNYDSIFGIETSDTSAQIEAKKNAFSSLPDGIYRVGITVSDYQPAKLKMEIPHAKTNDPEDADTVSVDIWNNVIPKKNGNITPADMVCFWIAVDSKDPQVDIVYGDGKTQQAGYISAKKPLSLYGTVSDENGPIVLVDWRARNIMTGEESSMSTQNDPEKAGAARVVTSTSDDPSVGLNKIDYSKGKWNYEFHYLMDMNQRTEGAYNFEITFRDRFGRTTTRTLTYSVDKKPPTISIIPIETFSRPALKDSELAPYTQVSEPGINKERLAVKVVNFTVTVSDENAIGLRWWLLPADKGADKAGSNNTGIVSEYDAFPATYTGAGGGITAPGTYYPPDVNRPGFSAGAYGVLNVDRSGTFTIAIDTERLEPPKNGNGEYRLHIIAMDDANNASNYASPPIIANSHVFQEIFVLQEEDRPYFGDVDNITPGVVVEGKSWPSVDMDVRSDANPTVLGTIFENNGFLKGDGTLALAYSGSITIWFSDSDATAKAPLPDTWETTVAAGGDLTGYKKIQFQLPADNFTEGINKMGGTKNYNVSLRIRLADRFPTFFNTDGYKRYIIMAKDSPVNKLKYDKTDSALQVPDGIPMGVGKTTSIEDEGVREARWRQFAFIYDANPPSVIITKPNETIDKPNGEYGNKFGLNFADSVEGFNLVGSIEDMNLATVAYYYENLPNDHKNKGSSYDANGKYNGADKDYYYFEYYVDSNSEARDIFVLDENRTGITVTKSPTGVDPPTKVEFNIKPNVVTAETKGIIPKTVFEADSFDDGQHTLNIFATDKSGREGGAWVGFTKDMKPPAIAFSNLNADSRPYDITNKSRVDKTSAGGATGWWSKTPAQRQAILMVNNPLNNPPTTNSPLTISTISYDKGTGAIPELRGTITDLVSNIKLSVGPDSDVGSGDVNISGSAFKYWIDNDGSGTPRYLALIDGEGTRSVRWTILLTDTGTTKGNVLPDGVHTIVLTAADDPGIEIPEGERYMIAFRIDSQAPKSAAGVGNAQAGVYGNAAYQNDTMFTINLGAQDANLDRVELSVLKQEEKEAAITQTFNARNTPSGATATWAYLPYTATAPLPALPVIPSAFIPPLDSNPITGPLKEDYVVFVGTYNVPKTLFNNVDGGKYDVKVVAYDTAGNKSEEFVWPFTYDKTQPRIEFTSPDKTNATGADKTLTPEDLINIGILPELLEADGSTKNNINRLTSENLRITGLVIDDFSAVSVVESRVEKWNWNGATNVVGTWTEVEGWKSIRNLTGNQLLQISWTKNLLGQNVGDLDLRTGLPATTAQTLGDNLAPAEGLYRIRVRAKDSSTIAKNPWVNGGNDLWVFPTGEGNPIVSDYVYFYFDRNNPELKITKINGADATMATYYREPPSGGFSFDGTVKDNNRVAKVEVLFRKTGATDSTPMTVTMSSIASPVTPADPAPTLNVGGVTQNWTARFADNAAKLSDGRYTVTITAYDMTGRSTREEKAFILDATNPTLRFTLPAKEPKEYKGFGDDSESKNFASKMVLGGETAVITGVTEDKPDDPKNKGDESGIDQMWFRLGFIDGATYTAANPFPTKTAIIADEDRLAAAVPAGAIPAKGANESDAAYRNRLMNYLADYRGTDNSISNSWFKLGGTEKPTGFIIDNPNIYDWRFEIPNNYPVSAANADLTATMTAMNVNPVTINSVSYYPIGGLKLYGNTITVKGRTYYVNPTGTTPNRQMVRAVDGQAGGVYRLPLWVRITDIAGNVEYYCHDIWINMNGDIPITSIESPSNGTRYNARGGAISVDGVARSNTSVYDVIFRVFADDVQDTNLDGIQTNNQPNPVYKTVNGTNNTLAAGRPAADKFIRIPGYNAAEAATIAKLPPDTYYTGTDWQRANLTLPGGAGEPLIPWSIMLNSGEHIASKITSDGFASAAGGSKDTIRVWLEVFVFSGEGTPVRSSIYPNDNLGTASYLYTGTNGGILYGTAEALPAPPAAPNANTPGPRPYVKSFYLKTGAVAITHPNVGTRSDGANTTPFTVPFRRGNVWWNAENAQNQGGGGYGGAGTETRNDKFAFSATLDPAFGSATSLLGEVSYRVKLDGGTYSTWATAWARNPPAGTTFPALPENLNSNGIRITTRTDAPSIGGARTRYYFDYLIDSKPGSGGALAGYTGIPVPGNANWFSAGGTNWSNTGGTITVQIRIRDNSSPPNEAEQTIQVGVDNFPPIGDDKSYGNSTVAGTNVTFQGRAYDFATSPAGQVMLKDSDFAPKKLKRVYAWFTKTTNSGTYYVNMNTGALGKAVSTTTTGTPETKAMTAFKDRNATTITGGGASEDTPTVIDITGNVGTPDQYYVPQRGTGETAWNAAYVREIDQATGQPANKMLWSPVKSLNYDVKWQFTLDSTKLPDGKITLHYVVEDEAGNASYYKQPDITVKNRYPEITRVTLYTDNNGQGAAFTKDDTIEYDLNDYRAKMFYNYTDTVDNQIPAGGTHSKSDTTGYLNSGFIAKNNYIGFRVETEKGNRPLTFRLQHVTRKRETLTAAKLQELLKDRNDPNNINLYTIAWHGDYSAANWKAIGVPIDKNPTLGMHFVLQWPEGSNVTAGTLPADYKSSNTAQVWKYTLRGTLTREVRPLPLTGTNPVPPQAQDPADDPVVLGPTAAFPGGVDFQFKGDTEFANILEKNGSRPDPGDTNPDYPIDSPANDIDSVNGTAFFLIRVWDSVGGTPTGEAAINETLHDALVVGMNVYKRDNINPVARLYDLNPYTETAVTEGNKNMTISNAANPIGIGNNIVRGGVYNDGTSREPVKSGFINPRGGSKALAPVNSNGVTLPDYPLRVPSDTVRTGSDPDQVSGKIILRGIAWDDQLIDEIRVRIGTGTPDASNTILKLDQTVGSSTRGKMVAYNAGIRGGQVVAFAAETLHWKTGHTVEWAYVWDTTLTNSGPATGVTIQVVVKDVKGSGDKPPTPPPSIPPGLTSGAPVYAADTGVDNITKFHNAVSVNIVPYITGFERQKPKFTTKRSLQGWYSFYQDEANIKVLGYNFGTGATNSITLNGAPVTMGTVDSATERTFRIPAGGSSGEILMTASGTAVYNNTVDVASATAAANSKSWNREYSSFTPGSDLWVNKPYAHIWRSNESDNAPRTYIGTTGTGTAATSFGLEHPGMALEYTGGNAGLLHGTWAVYGNAVPYYGRSNNQANALVSSANATEPYLTPDISIFNGGSETAANIGFSYQGDGDAQLRLKSVVTTQSNGTTIQGSTTNHTTQRWKNVRISKADANSGTANDNVGRIYMTANDAPNKGLWYGMRNGTNNNTVFIDGGNATGGVGGLTAAGSAGEFSAVDYDSTGPIIAYYDQTNDTVRIALGGNNPTQANSFTRNYLLPETGSGSELRRGSGRYISIKVDKKDGIHLAFYNSVYNSVVYYYAATRASISRDGTATNGVSVKCHTIDNVVTGGIWTDISVDNNGNPWIVYGDSSRTGNYDGVRIAYLGSFARSLTCPVTKADITGWEALTMPANYVVNNDRLNIEAWPPTVRGNGTTLGSPNTSITGTTMWNAAIGYPGGVDSSHYMYRVGYFYLPTIPTGSGF